MIGTADRSMQAARTTRVVPFENLLRRIKKRSFTGTIKIEGAEAGREQYFLVLDAGQLAYIGSDIPSAMGFLDLLNLDRDNNVYTGLANYARGPNATIASVLKLVLDLDLSQGSGLRNNLFARYRTTFALIHECNFKVIPVRVNPPVDLGLRPITFDVDAVLQAALSQDSSGLPSEFPNNDRLKILHVDDRKVANLLVRRVLDGHYNITHCENAAAALSTLETEEEFALILLDFELPDMSGIELCEKIRKSGRHKSIPIIMLTARGGWMDRWRGKRVGADRYLVKPFEDKQLLEAVESAIRTA